MPEPSPALAGRTILVTGASRGFGAAVAVACAAAGAKLILTARTRGALEETDDAVRKAGGEATLIQLDLADGELVDKLGAPLFERFGKLDGLVAAAAELGPLTPTSHLKPADLERVMAINFVANQRLIRTLDPLLRVAEAGRAVFVTDAEAQRGRPYWGAYAASKQALESLVLGWAGETRLTNLKINLVDPGPMRTRLRVKAYPGEAAERNPLPELIAPGVVPLLAADCPHHGELVRLQAG
ncbi:MAG: SDR family NAD(P)-dependent oxidoreductase [Geminicoccaceae bacterium]